MAKYLIFFIPSRFSIILHKICCISLFCYTIINKLWETALLHILPFWGTTGKAMSEKEKSRATLESHRNYLAEAQHISEALLQEQAGIRNADKLLYQAKEGRNQCVTAEFTAEDK